MSSQLLRPPPLSLYVHIPWCVRKCPYCDFNSHESSDPAALEEPYVEALVADLREQSDAAGGRELLSIFFGGGTPSLFSADAIERVLAAADRYVGISADCEITLEANPGTAERAHFAGYRAAGVNRLSIGAQSFDDAALSALGRIHCSDEIGKAVGKAREAGFDNINIDLMHGLPGQSVAGALHDLERAIELDPEHISWYELTIEPNTAFYKHPPKLPAESVLADITERGGDLLQRHGYRRYEVSAYARDNRESRHNLNYWLFGDYLGIGAGAHGKLSDSETGTIARTKRSRLPEHYLARGSRANSAEPVAADALPFEFLMNALRLMDPVEFALFEAHTGQPESVLRESMAPLERDGLVSITGGSFQATALGSRFLNETLARLLP